MNLIEQETEFTDEEIVNILRKFTRSEKAKITFAICTWWTGKYAEQIRRCINESNRTREKASQ